MKYFKILVTGNGKLAKELYKLNSEIFHIKKFSKFTMNIIDESRVEKIIKQITPDYIIHTAALTKPMDINDKNPINCINTNIIGTANIAKLCYKNNIKFIYISTDYIYDESGNNIDPTNNYALSKLTSEYIAKIIGKSLILRCALCDIPFRHKYAYTNIYRNSITHRDVAKIILKLRDHIGIINIGGKYQSVYDFVKNYQTIKALKCEDNKIKSIKMNNCIN